jgi:DNA invertase Pin-like site-specific DNA recombinase
MTYAYLRVSTDKQDYENQKTGVVAMAERMGLTIDKEILDDGVSGAKDPKKRELGKWLRKMHKGDTLLCSEISRLGRELYMIMRILEYLSKNEIHLHTDKDNFHLCDDIQSKVLAFAFGLSAEIERRLISQRTKEALARKRAEGVQLGGVPGKRLRLNPRCEAKHQWIIAELEKGTEKVIIAKKLKVSKCTLYRYLVYTGLYDPKKCERECWKKYGIYR